MIKIKIKMMVDTVPESRLNLNLASQLPLVAGFFQLVFLDHFQCHDES